MPFKIKIQHEFNVYEDAGEFDEVMERLRMRCPSGFLIEAVLHPVFSCPVEHPMTKEVAQ